MAEQNPRLNKIVGELSLRDILDLHTREVMLDFNCHAIGTVEKFDPVKQTVQATINYKKTNMERQDDGTYQPAHEDYPLIVDMPIVTLTGGKSALTMPIAPGDTCLILFNDRDIDRWFASGQVTTLGSFRLHDFADGIALVGLRSAGKAVVNFDTTRAVLRNDKAMVGVGPSLLKLSNDVTTLKTILNNLCDAVTGMVVTGVAPSGGGPITAGMVSGIAAIKTQIGSLLE